MNKKVMFGVIIGITFCFTVLIFLLVLYKTGRPDYSEDDVEEVAQEQVESQMLGDDNIDDLSQDWKQEWKPYEDLDDSSTIISPSVKYALPEGTYAISIFEEVANTTLYIYSQETDEVRRTIFLENPDKFSVDVSIDSPCYLISTNTCVVDNLD